MQLTTLHWGEPTGVTAVCVHGITGNAVSWGRVATHLVSAGYHVVAPELRGHGNSPAPPSGYALDELVGDLVDTVGSEVDVLIGHSFGGTLATIAVAQGRIRVHHVLLEDPVLAMPDKEHAAAVVDPIIAQTRVGLGDVAAQEPQWSLTDIAGRVLAQYQMSASAVRQAWVGNAPWDLHTEVGRLTGHADVLVVLPECSPYSDTEDIGRMRRGLGENHVIEIAGAGHSVHLDRPKEFLAVLDTLINGRSTNSSTHGG
jgi:pimeloyl-ACP methyl ester carboxylesterase